MPVTRVLTIAYVADYCNVLERAVVAWCDSGELKTVRPYPHYDRRIRRPDLDEFLAKHSGVEFNLPDTSDMRREITSHKGSGVNDSIEIRVIDESGDGGASHAYEMILNGGARTIEMRFQHGPVDEGFNGFSDESLLAIVVDRLGGFQELGSLL